MHYCCTADPLGAGQMETNPRPSWETGVFPRLPPGALAWLQKEKDSGILHSPIPVIHGRG